MFFDEEVQTTPICCPACGGTLKIQYDVRIDAYKHMEDGCGYVGPLPEFAAIVRESKIKHEEPTC